MPVTNNSINLIRSQEPSFFDKFLRWALTLGRFLVILTETTALAMFLYRFDIDRQLIDLHDLIKQKQFIVSHLEQSEIGFRNLQDRLSLAKAIQSDPQSVVQLYSTIFELGKQNITFTTLTVSNTALAIDASTNSRSALQTFVTAVRANPFIGSLSIDKIDNKTATGTITFILTGEVKIPKPAYEK